jgi:uncharacterized protein YjiS (DUF1127 family)
LIFSSRNVSHKRTQILILIWAKMAFDVVRKWRHRYRSRRELASLSYRERDDIGAGDANAEIASHFGENSALIGPDGIFPLVRRKLLESLNRK